MSKIYGRPVATPIKPAKFATEVDKELATEGKAADAKATGDKFRGVNTAIQDLGSGIAKIGANIGTLQNYAADIYENLAQVDKSLDTTNARIDNITSLPSGSTTGDAELIDTRVGFGGVTYTNAGGAIRGQAEENFRLIESMDSNLTQQTGGHFYKILVDMQHEVISYRNVNGTIQEDTVVAGSRYIKCPKYLCVVGLDPKAKVIINFYTIDDNGNFTPYWDDNLLNEETTKGGKNYVDTSVAKLGCLEIPEGTYMKIAPRVGELEYYGWDGEAFGLPLCADSSYNLSTGASTPAGPAALSASGNGNITIPGCARVIVLKDGVRINPVYGWKSGEYTAFATTNKRALALPAGYDFFTAKAIYATKKTWTGDASAFAGVVVTELDSQKASGRAVGVLESGEKINSLRWTPKKNIYLPYEPNENAELDEYGYPVPPIETFRSFKAGVEYNGLPYSGNWSSQIHFVGWHVSPHTFLNAVNDEESVFYTMRSYSDGTYYPYYGIVCSSFTTMSDGWPYPQTNPGFLYDPNVVMSASAVPPIGMVWSDIDTHCCIPARVDHMEKEWAITAIEGIRPVSTKTIRYSNIASKDVDTHNHGSGKTYYNDYGFAVRHRNASGNLNNVPYADFDGATITGGSARPNKGDKSVYTSAEENVYVNIKNSNAEKVYLAKGDGEASPIDINGATRIDVKEHLTGEGIYYVWTDADSTVKESFEFIEVTEIIWKLVDGCVQFSSNDFWYANVQMKGNPRKSGPAMIPANASGDYSDWCRNGHYMTKVSGIFKKGTYGAYYVPCKEEAETL